MLQVNGVCKVCQLERKGKAIKGNLYWGVKSVVASEEVWESEFVSCVFVGESAKLIDLNGTKNKDKIEITNAVLRVNKYKDKNGNTKSFTQVVIFDYIPFSENNKVFGKSDFDK